MKYKRIFFTILVFLFFSCKSQIEKKSNAITQFLNNNKICFELHNKTKDCLDLENKLIYINPNKNIQDIDFFLLPNKKDFLYLSKNRKDVINQLDTLKNELSILYKELKFNITTDIKTADIILQASPIITINKYNYILISIKERKSKIWGIKLKMKNNNIISSEIIQILD